MSDSIVKTISKPKLSVKLQTLYALLAIAAAVALPQLFHVIGAVSGMGTILGETFLPMHIPVILVGLLAGPFAGAAAGLLAPLASFAITGMPGSAMLPFMVIELGAYGIASGLLRNVKMINIGKLFLIQLSGRALRAAAILTAVYLIGSSKIAVSVIWTSIAAGLPGLVLQWLLIPLAVYRIEGASKHGQ